MQFDRASLLSPALAATLAARQLAPLRPPAIPLIAHDPYFSVWSDTDKTHRQQSGSLDRKTEQPLGIRADRWPRVPRHGREQRRNTPALDQTRVEVLPTRTVYEFSGVGVNTSVSLRRTL